ncbi:hypothetical protein AB0D30_36780 [Streptomyces sp. NPDC048409]|uniref:hypothetical protein n=1 Tax=Streptomyces sp. NPDC048409 TaxID=3154723 RepID=UPI00343218DC
MNTAECDALPFADARGSMVEIVQTVGRALRMRPGTGKLPTLIVPVFPGDDEGLQGTEDLREYLLRQRPPKTADTRA